MGKTKFTSIKRKELIQVSENVLKAWELPPSEILENSYHEIEFGGNFEKTKALFFTTPKHV